MYDQVHLVAEYKVLHMKPEAEIRSQLDDGYYPLASIDPLHTMLLSSFDCLQI
jgi:hypothetical protein